MLSMKSWTERTLAAARRSLLDADGSAIVLHATADDYMTIPLAKRGWRHRLRRRHK